METELEFRGEYYPAFFSIYLEGDFTEKFEDLDNKDLGTLAHEYLHYIQNIDTLMGISNSQHFFSLYNEVLKQASTNCFSKETFQLPNKIAENKAKFDKYFGQSYSDTTIDFDDSKLEIDGETVKVLFYKGKHCIKTVDFGNLCVKEGMAHYFQLIFDNNAEHPFLPYDVISIVCKNLYPKLLEEPIKIILLSYLALSSSINSGLQFYKLLEEIKNNESYYSALSPIELYNNIKDSLQITISGRTFKSVNHAKTFAIDRLNEIMSASMISEMRYFDTIFCNIKEINCGKENGFAEIITDSSTNKYQKLCKLFNIYKSPNIRTTTGKNYFPDSSQELIELVGKKLLLERILQDENQCKYFAFCSGQEENPTGNQCFSFEWDNEKSCLFTLAYEYFQIKKANNSGL
ncbi:hypothetical protein ACFSKL_06820 [Belliella marina]|uniref:Uncharacterized protein n=1 Tax=Belliella marina TaxID=1644146 RepID=A0ABW4VLC3_9BACT